MKTIEKAEEQVKQELADNLLTERGPIMSYLRGRIKEHLDIAEDYKAVLKNMK